MTVIFALERSAMETLSTIINSQSNKSILTQSYLEACKIELAKFCFSYRYAEQSGSELGQDYVSFLKSRLRKRVQLLARFHIKISAILERTNLGKGLHVTFLNGDSHNSAQRPLLLETENGRFVIKLTDPRTTLIYNDVLSAIQRGCGLSVEALQVDYDSSYHYQISPYLEHSNSSAINAHEYYGYLLGIHLTTSYFLQMTDLHFENVLTSSGIPYIIDTECMLYGFYGHSTSSPFRLMNTGLIAPTKRLSGINGGSENVSEIALNIKDKKVRYTHKNNIFHNRITDEHGQIIPTDAYKKNIISGFRDSYLFLAANKLEIINSVPSDHLFGFRTRFLIRTTAHYKTVIDRIFSPNLNGRHSRYLESTLSTFSRSGFLPDEINNATLVNEVNDLLDGDIPYFWVGSADHDIYHHTKVTMKYSQIPNLRTRLDRAIQSYLKEDIDHLSTLLDDYL